MAKRARISYGSGKSRRPIDKKLVNVNMAPSNNQLNQGLFTASGACTLTGLRWSFAINADGATALADSFRWALVILPDGISTPSTMAYTATSSFYEPEQHVLAFGAFPADASNTNNSRVIEGSTKAMRKMRDGDQLVCIAGTDSSAGAYYIDGVVQLFCMQ